MSIYHKGEIARLEAQVSWMVDENDALRKRLAVLERVAVAAELLRRWESQVPPHGGMASDLKFLFAALDAAREGP